MAECDIPSFGTFIRESNRLRANATPIHQVNIANTKNSQSTVDIYFNPCSVMVEESKMIRSYVKRNDSKKEDAEKSILRTELNLGRCAEVCNTSRDLVKSILVMFSTIIVS